MKGDSARLLRRFITGVHIMLALGLGYGTVRRLLAPEGIVDTDFTVFRTAWWLILHGSGDSLYDVTAQRITQQLLMGHRHFEGGLMAFLNPPHAALAGLPLGWVADHAGAGPAFAIWAGVNALLLLRLDQLTRDLFGVRHGELRWTITFALLAFYPVWYTIAIGQLSLLLAVAAFELFRMLEAGRPVAAAIWLMALSVKPQLLPPVLVLLVLRGYWRTLGWTAAIGAGVAATSAAVLGISIWFDYVRNLHALEQFFALGTPTYMMNLRGALTQLVGAAVSPAAIYLIAIGAWIAAMGALAFVVLRRGAASVGDLSTDFALALGVALFFSPHLFPQDTAIWIVALVLYIHGLRARGGRWPRVTAFALLWPSLFALSRALGDGLGGTLTVRPSPAIVVMLVALALMTSTALRTRSPAPSP